jgi:hypothetical protein
MTEQLISKTNDLVNKDKAKFQILIITFASVKK